MVSQLHSQWHPQDLINYDSVYKIAENVLSTSFWFHHSIFIKWWVWAFYHLVIYIGDRMTNCPDRSQGVCKQHPCSMLEPGKKSSQKFSKKQGVGPSHKPFNTIGQHWMVYGNQWEGCDDFYIAERARPFGMRFKEHVAITRASTAAVGDHLKW